MSMVGDDIEGPTPERLGRGDLERAGRRWFDDHGQIGLPYLVVGVLARMARAATITQNMHKVGERFAADFAIAKLDPRHAPDLARIPGQEWRDDGAMHVAAARIRVHDALKKLGGNASVMGSCCWHVLGCGDSLRAWTTQRGMAKDHGSGVLIAALSLLEGHYGR